MYHWQPIKDWAQPRYHALAYGTAPFAVPYLRHCAGGAGDDCVIDGDTIRIHGERMRLRGIDAPETHTDICGGQRERALGNRAKERLAELLNAGEGAIYRYGSDAYGRALVEIQVDGRDVGDILVAEGLARRWPNGREWWCD